MRQMSRGKDERNLWSGSGSGSGVSLTKSEVLDGVEQKRMFRSNRDWKEFCCN